MRGSIAPGTAAIRLGRELGWMGKTEEGRMSSVLDKFDLSGKAAIVTGGAGLLGAEFCRTLAQAGASVVIADRMGDAARAAADRLRCRRAAHPGRRSRYHLAQLGHRAGSGVSLRLRPAGHPGEQRCPRSEVRPGAQRSPGRRLRGLPARDVERRRWPST